MTYQRGLDLPPTGPGSTTLAFDLPDGTPTSALLIRARGYEAAHIDLVFLCEEPVNVNMHVRPGGMRWFSPIMTNLYSPYARTAIGLIGQYYEDRAHQVELATRLADHYSALEDPTSAGDRQSAQFGGRAAHLAAAAVLTDTLQQSKVALSMVRAGYTGTVADLLAAAGAATTDRARAAAATPSD